MGKIVHIVLLKMNDGADQKVYEQWLTEGPKMQGAAQMPRAK